MKRFLKIAGGLTLVLFLALASDVAYRLTPKQLDLPLPEARVALNTQARQALLESSDHAADYPVLAESWEGQKLISYCGVAAVSPC